MLACVRACVCLCVCLLSCSWFLWAFSDFLICQHFEMYKTSSRGGWVHYRSAKSAEIATYWWEGASMCIQPFEAGSVAHSLVRLVSMKLLISLGGYWNWSSWHTCTISAWCDSKYGFCYLLWPFATGHQRFIFLFGLAATNSKELMQFRFLAAFGFSERCSKILNLSKFVFTRLFVCVCGGEVLKMIWND